MGAFYDRLLEYKEYGVADHYKQAIDGKTVLDVKFQKAARGDDPASGIFIEDLLIVAYAKLHEYQYKFPCRENAIALTNIEEAVMWLEARTADRSRRGVEGKDEA